MSIMQAWYFCIKIMQSTNITTTFCRETNEESSFIARRGKKTPREGKTRAVRYRRYEKPNPYKQGSDPSSSWGPQRWKAWRETTKPTWLTSTLLLY